MKKIIFALGLLVCIATITQLVVAKPGLPSFKAGFNWTSTTFDFGKIKQNVPVTHEFTFTNKGNEPLVVASVQASCGCTITAYSKDPIAPGNAGFVTATYDAAKVGVFSKTVTVQANTPEGAVQLSIKGIVVGD